MRRREEGRCAYYDAMLFGAHPYMSVTPFAQLSQLLDFGMGVLNVILHRQAFWIIYADIAAQAE